jgi:xanthine dehydrogenase molybdopterin-binding subunit B
MPCAPLAECHARIASITVSAALARTGVLAIFTGRDIVGPHWLIKEARATYRCL